MPHLQNIVGVLKTNELVVLKMMGHDDKGLSETTRIKENLGYIFVSYFFNWKVFGSKTFRVFF